MAGANYTGGKRNVARTRFRDSTRRAQKSHFGCRRLGILSRSLVNRTHSKEEETTSGISGILLEHAQREISCPSMSTLAHQTGALGAFTSEPPSSTVSSRTGSSSTSSNLKATHLPDNGSYSSLRAEVKRVLEFSRTVGLCNYPTSRRQRVPASSISHLDSVSRRLDPPRERNEGLISPMSGFSARQRPKTRTPHATQGSEILQVYQTRTQLYSPRETVSFYEPTYESETDLVYVKPTSDHEYLEHYTSQSAQSKTTSTVEPRFGQDKDSSGVLERNLFSTDPLPPSFDALEFPTSPLPPSSPLLSSTTHESLLSLRQMSHGPETTLLDFDKIPLPSTVGGSCEVSSSPRYGGSHFKYQTPGLASVPPLLHLHNLHSGLANKVPPILLPSSCKADLIPDLLTCEDPWNVIGDVLGLPPIPSTDATYFSRVRSLHTIPYECVSSVASSGLGQVDVGEPPITAGEEGSQLKAVHSHGDPFIRPDSSQRLIFSCEALRHASSPLLCQDTDSSVKRVLSPARSFRSCQEDRLLGCAEFRCLSPSTSGNIPVLGEALPGLFEPQTPPSPRAPDGTPGEGWENSSVLVKTNSPSPRISISQRPTSPFSKNSISLKTSASRSPEVVSKKWNEMTGSDLVAPIPKVPIIQTTTSKVQLLSKLEFPDLFQDEDNLGSLF